MSNEEAIKIMDKVKANYQHFKSDEVYIISEWTQRLRQYSFKEVEEELDKYIESGNKEIPRIGQLVRNLHTIKQKEDSKNIKGKFYCRWCDTEYSKIEHVHLCEERCLRLNWMAKMIDLFRIDPIPIFGKGIFKCKLQELNDGYDALIIEILKREEQEHLLKPLELQGIKAYYENCIKIKN